ncbi:hypothetical protein JW721_06210 [Candidatus Micrarchaeota archaeon]|nr:hypothetical protein [Candidatus Micrarchaeota archaeon]
MVKVICSECGQQIIHKKDLAGCRGLLDSKPVCRKCYFARMEKRPISLYRDWSHPSIIALIATGCLVSGGAFLLSLAGILAVLWMGISMSLVQWALSIGFMLFCFLVCCSVILSWGRLYFKYGRYLK